MPTAPCSTAASGTRRLLALAALLAGSAAAFAAPPLYRITDIGMVEGFGRVFPIDINDHGDVLGVMEQSLPARGARPFVWRPASGLQVGDRLYQAGWLDLVAGNNRGLALAQRYDAFHQLHPFTVSAAGGFRRLQRPAPGSWATAHGLNDAGEVVGSVTDNVQQHAVVWRPGVGLVDVHPAGFQFSAGHAINRHGDIAATLVEWHITKAGLIDRQGHATVFPCLDNVVGDCRAEASALNDVGQVVGSSQQHGGWRTQAFIWSAADGTRSLMAGGLYADCTSSTQDVNDRGEVVGTLAGTVDGVPVSGPFRWHADDGVGLLADLIDPADPLAGRVRFIMSGRVRINGPGTIVLTGWIDGAPEIHGLVLVPVR